MNDAKRQELPDLGADGSREYRLGIMGGTFDPIHYGHLVTAEQAREALDLDVVLFMPAGTPAFKPGPSVSHAEARYAMTLVATAGNPGFEASRFEIDRPGTTYTVDTLRALRDHYPDNVKLFFITGTDAMLEILTWREAESMANLATFIAATRPGYDIDQAHQRLEASHIDFDVRYIEIPALAVSSTYIRERVRQGKSVRYLTPGPVIGYIYKNGLYAAGQRDRADLWRII